jgi:hypothetical protein
MRTSKNATEHGPAHSSLDGRAYLCGIEVGQVLAPQRSSEHCVVWVAVVARADGTRVGPRDSRRFWAGLLPSWPRARLLRTAAVHGCLPARPSTAATRLFRQDVNSSRLRVRPSPTVK